jgi:glycosyltransferase involved in cell wall biosynthesis
MPFFSIVIPTVNREALLQRALDSVLAQGFGDYEIVVVDSASTDGTRGVVRGYAERDSRVRLVTEEVRRGVCPARNLGVDSSTAPWIVFLDSDDELAPGALEMIAGHARSAEPEVGLLRFSCRWDDGTVSPYPPLTGELWDYAGYVRFLDRTVGYSPETLMCVRRETFGVIRWPEDRSYEMLYHLDFAQRFRQRTFGEVARLYHTDAPDQNTFVPNPQHWLRVAPDMARTMRGVIARHGQAMREIGPAIYKADLRGAMKFSLLAGQRLAGFQFGMRLLARAPFSLRAWMILLAGLVHRRVLARVDAANTQMRGRRSARAVPQVEARTTSR